MHIGRRLVLVGSVFAIIGLALTVLIMDGMDALPALSQAVPVVPDGIPTIFGGLDTWAKVVVVVLLVVIVVLAVRPRTKQPQTGFRRASRRWSAWRFSSTPSSSSSKPEMIRWL